MIELVKNNNALSLVGNDSNVELKSTMLKGDKGGYYKPTVEDGVLSWEATEPEMPQIESTDLISVDSVNGMTGAVVLDAESVGALPEDTYIPSIEGLATEIYVDEAVATERANREKGISDLEANYKEADIALQNKINAVDTAYKEADTALQLKVNTVEANYKEADTAIQENINSINTEYKKADQAILTSIDTLEANYKNADSNIEKRIEEEIARANAAESVNALAITNLQSEDTKINSRLDAEIVAREEAHTAIKADCKAENDAIKVLIGNEKERALAAESELQSSIEAETANRDKAIKAAIDAIPEVDLTPYAKTADLPTKVSAFENDKGYLTEHQSLKGYATETYVDKAIDDIPDVDLSPYAKTTYVDEKVASIVDTAPEALNTLNELSAALGDDPNFATTVSTEIGKKVDKVDGKELSSNDFTDAYKSKLDGIAANANKYTHPTTHPASMITGLSAVATTGSYTDLKNIPEAYKHPDTHSVDMITGLHTVATSGSYMDLKNKPTIPAAYVHPDTHPADMITGLSRVATSGSYKDLANKPTIPSTYTHPDTHPVDMITGLHSVATSGDYNDLSNKPAAYTHPSTHPASMITGLATVATSGSYNDLSNKPTIPAAYTHPSTHPASMITGLATVATSGSYADLSNKPTIPTIPASLPANGGNADTVDSKHIVVSSSIPTTTDTNIITFVV